MHGIKPEKLIPAQETNLIQGTLILIWLIMNYTTIKLSYKCFCKNISHLFFFFLPTDFVPGMKIYACREPESAVLRGMIYSVPKLSPTTISLRSSPYLHIQIAPVILMTTLLFTCEDTQFQKLALPLGLAYGVTQGWIWKQFCSCGCGKSHTYCCLWNCTRWSIGITHNCFHKIRRKELEQPYWYKSWWQHVLQVQKGK